jgi:hypothetical protein
MSPSAWRVREPILMALPLLLGMLAFWGVVGPGILDPKNIAWLADGADSAQHYLGWVFFRHSQWSFPVGLNPDYGLEIGNAIVFSDSNPLLALIFKPFDPILPDQFQYFGIWLFACFVLQAWFGWQLLGLFSRSIAIRLCGAGLFVFAPPMLGRVVLMHHQNLAAHFLVLAALYISLNARLQRRKIAWSFLLSTAALVHGYLMAMVAGVWLADVSGRVLQRRSSIKGGIFEVWAILSILALVCWQAGYFTVGAGIESGGFGVYRMNLLSIINPGQWSRILHFEIPVKAGEHEGFNYFGLGGIFLLICAISLLAVTRIGIWRRISQFKTLLVLLVALTLFSISNKVGIGAYEFDYNLPDSLIRLSSVFQSSGRMFWPVFYTILFVAIYIIVRTTGERVAAYIVASALLMQIVDTSNAWTQSRMVSMNQRESAWKTPLNHEFWQEAASKYKKVRWIPPGNLSPNWVPLATFAATHELATDAVYLARMDMHAWERAQRKAAHTVQTGTYEIDSLYVLDDSVLRQAVFNLTSRTDALARIDNLNVIAPGWNNCTDCGLLLNQVKLTDLFPTVAVGERMSASQAGSGVPYLVSGWSVPGEAGTWSDGETSEIFLPAPDKVTSIVLEAHALVAPTHPTQEIEVKINDHIVFVGVLTKPENQIELPLPNEMQADGARLVRIELIYSNAVRPKDIGLSEDGRKLALMLRSITVR